MELGKCKQDTYWIYLKLNLGAKTLFINHHNPLADESNFNENNSNKMVYHHDNVIG